MRLLKKGALPRLDLPKIRRNRLVEIIPLSTGCLGSCTYCKTRHARGRLGSYTPHALLDRVQAVLNVSAGPLTTVLRERIILWSKRLGEGQTLPAAWPRL